jgi:sodium-dependent dicarboxylate transporter 2/3/5
VGTPPNIVLVGQTKQLFPELPEIGFGQWMLLGVPVSLCMLGAAYLVLIFWGARHRLPREELASGGREILLGQARRLGPLAGGEVRVLVVFCVTVFLWLTRQPLPLGAFEIPGWSTLFPEPRYLHDATVAIAAGVVLCAMRARHPESGEFEAVLDWKSIRTRTPWGILLLFGGGFALASGFHQSGLAEWIGGRLQGLGGLPLPAVMVMTCVITMILTEVTSNTATSTLLMPILAALAVSLDAPPLLLMIPAALSASCAFMLPVATPPNAIVFGSGWIGIREMARVGFVLNLVGVAVITLLCWFLAPLVMGPGAR